MKEKKKILVFVYGTLRPELKTRAIVVERNDSINGVVINLGHFPALITTRTDLVVEGDVVEIDEETLAALDKYEGYPHFYTRRTVVTSAGHSALVYQFSDSQFIKRWTPTGVEYYG